jgi:hypothetical protein
MLHPVLQITMPEIDAGLRLWTKASGCEIYIFIFEKDMVERRIPPPLAGLWSELSTVLLDMG